MQENPLHQSLAQPPDLISRYHLLLTNPLLTLNDTGGLLPEWRAGSWSR